MKRCLLFAASLLLVVLPGRAQRNQLRFIRLSEDNDAINVRHPTDREYTNGTRLEVFYTKTTKPRFLTTLLIPLKGRTQEGNAGQVNNLYGIGLTQLMYTPWDLTREDVMPESRPYAAVLYAAHSLTSADPVRHQRLTTELGLGVLGKAALGKQVQTWVHKRISCDKPQGWEHQLPTDIVINYLIQYEKLFVQPSPNLQILGLVSTNVGSLSNNINAGLTLRAGVFHDYFANHPLAPIGTASFSSATPRKYQLYFFMRPLGRLVMDDSVLQGGIFTRHRADHTIYRNALRRGIGQFEYGAVFSYNRLGISVSQKLITPQYEGAPTQEVGNPTLFVGL